MPRISAVMPLYHGIKYIEESLQSIQAQTFSDWELIVVSEYGEDDGSEEIVRYYAQSDSRIRLIKNTKQEGLAESLNRGIASATGEYVARVDVDDPSYPERFRKQLDFMSEHPDVFLCGTLQRSVTPNGNYVVEVPCDAEELKAALLFGCEISHCSVLFRRNIWIGNSLRYPGDSLCEDYDLWTRIMFRWKLVNLPEVLVDHRWGYQNISIAKGERLHAATREVSLRTLRNEFDMKLAQGEEMLVCGWRAEPGDYASKNKAEYLKKSLGLLEQLESKNRKLQKIDGEALRRIIWKRWNWTCRCCGIFFEEKSYEAMRREAQEPVVSVILPVYHAVDTLRETIDSVLRQSFPAWELIIVCEFGNSDGSTELAKAYMWVDKRIRVVENKKMEGLASSLNIGISHAGGRYLARIDADDLMNASRLETQVSYMEQHPEVGITQFYQHYFGTGSGDFIHRPPRSAEAMKAKLLFFCDACHSTVMLRKETVVRYALYYDERSALEDFELWSRAIRVTDFVTIPEIYGEFRTDGIHISHAKTEAIREEMCRIQR